MDFAVPSDIVISCHSRLSPFVEQEVRALGFNPIETFATAVRIRGSLADCITLNLHLRCASQVNYSLKSFAPQNADDLYREVVDIAWEEVFDESGYVSVTSHVEHPSINNNLFVNVKVKDALADRFRQVKGRRPDSGPELDQGVVFLFWKGDKAEIFVDTSGQTLAKHSYRKIPGKAPMLEGLASATILASAWDTQTPFINPMCGSGTLAIEAAMIATKRYPGLLRENYAFMHIKDYPDKLYKQKLRELRTSVKDASVRIIASDNRQDAINISRENAAYAGVDQMITFEKCDFADTTVPLDGNGVIFFNPEYGERMGDEIVLEETYARIGDFLKQKGNSYRGYIFTGNLDLAKKIGLKAKQKIPFFSAQLDCRLLEYELYAGSRRKDTPTA